MIYLSHVLNNHTPTYGGKNLCKIEHIKKISTGYSSNNSQLHISSHAGTHIDAPYHFCDDGKTIDDYPPEFWFCSHPYLIDVDIGISEIIQLDLIKKSLTEIPILTDILLLRTGYEKIRDLKDKRQYIFSSPGVGTDVGSWLRENRSIKMIGLDFISLSSYADREEGHRAHRAFLNPYEISRTTFDPILIIEDMKLSKYNENFKNIIVMPLRVQNGDGAPVTVVAW